MNVNANPEIVAEATARLALAITNLAAVGLQDTVAKLERFAAAVELAQLQRLEEQGLDCEANQINCRTVVKLKSKYAYVDVGRSGKFMVEILTGDIYGIKGYGQIHRGHRYGNIADISGYNWGGYHPVAV